MKKSLPIHGADRLKKGYNEKNPGQSQGAFPPDAASQRPKTKEIKSNAADKKVKEDSQ